MKAFQYHILLLFKRVLLILVLLAFSRLLFYLFNMNSFSDLGFWEVAKLFFIGIRFDVSAISYLNAPFILLSLFPLYFMSTRGYQAFLKVLYLTINSALLIVSFFDIKLFEHTSQRFTTDIFAADGFINQFSASFFVFVKEYWYLVLLVVFVVYLLVKLYPKFCMRKLKISSNKPNKVIIRWVFRGVIVMLFVFFARGMFWKQAFNNENANKYATAKHVPLIQNSGLTIIF